jgi:hypothetical protein
MTTKKQNVSKETRKLGVVQMPRLLSVNVGLPREISWHGQTVYTSVWKEPVQGRRLVRRLNIDGDAQGDLTGHGGEQRAPGGRPGNRSLRMRRATVIPMLWRIPYAI